MHFPHITAWMLSVTLIQDSVNHVPREKEKLFLQDKPKHTTELVLFKRIWTWAVNMYFLWISCRNLPYSSNEHRDVMFYLCSSLLVRFVHPCYNTPSTQQMCNELFNPKSFALTKTPVHHSFRRRCFPSNTKAPRRTASHKTSSYSQNIPKATVEIAGGEGVLNIREDPKYWNKGVFTYAD